MICFVTGGAGFIGSHLVDKLIELGHEVTVLDNLSNGKESFLKQHFNNRNFKLIKGDLLDLENLKNILKGHDIVYHMAANSEVRGGPQYFKINLNQNTIATYNLLESMRVNNVKNIVFASSSVVYGEPKKFPTPEDYGPLLPISSYGASKLACEAFISAYSSMYKIKSWIFRFANIVGSRATHGAIFDFIEKLKKDSSELEVLGNGKQKKSYLLVKDCIDGMIFGVNHAKDLVNVFNLGSGDQILVEDLAKIVVKKVSPNAKIQYTGGDRGWEGDVPTMLLDVSKINKLGWKSPHTSKEAVEIATEAVKKERWNL